MGRATRFGVVGLAVVVTVAAAYVLGSKAGGVWDNQERAERRLEYRSKALAQSRAILDRMGTVAVGDTLTDFSFEDIDGNLHRLSEILVDPTLLIYVKPDCEACLEEIWRLSRTAHTAEDYRHFILISTANPLHLRKLRDDYDLQCYVLYDEERFLGNALKIGSFPFGLLVNRSRVVLEASASALAQDQLEEIVRH